MSKARVTYSSTDDDSGQPAPDPVPEKSAKPAKSDDVPPGMVQYIEIRAANPDCILYYRMGDFYELFFDDAKIASQVLGITLTKRGKYLGADVPMAGVPVKSANEYLQKLIAAGLKVAVCEQMEDPAEAKKRGHKAVVRREVVRIVTPGTITEDNLLEGSANNYLTAIFRRPGAGGSDAAGEAEPVALASLDLSTGEFLLASVSIFDLGAEIARLAPGELLLPDRLYEVPELRGLIEDVLGARAKHVLSPLPFAHFNALSGETILKEKLKVATLDAFGVFTRSELAAVGGLLKYVELTQLGAQPAVRPPVRQGGSAVMVIDAATRASLELLRTQSGARALSLLDAVDRTVTNAGARALAARLASPLTAADRILRRLDGVSFLADEETLLEQLRQKLRSCPDVARSLSRIVLGRASPRDLGAMRSALGAAIGVRDLLDQVRAALGLPDVLERVFTVLPNADFRLFGQLSAALVDELPAAKSDGGLVRAGHHAELDESRSLRDESRQILAALQARYAEETDIKALKIRHNNVLGYFIEVKAANADKLQAAPFCQQFTHRQTLANVVRFSSLELSETEAKIVRAADRALEIEAEIFAKLIKLVCAMERHLADIADALARLDHYGGLAVLAREQNYIRPRIDDSRVFDIRGGRHPVVEQALAGQQQSSKESVPFIENDCQLGRAPAPDLELVQPASSGATGFDDGAKDAETSQDLDPDPRLLVLTGPNMAGKSTYLRQNALITVLAQMGSFVPAQTAHIGIVDRLFSRVGASDDLARGRSTFMVEMVETAAILNQASDRSLVILDEIGRGTATYDGLSIAWAVVEYLHETCCARALFATHYHELTALANQLTFAANATIEVKEWKDDIVFLYRVIWGAADRSYGIQVAKLAGLPGPVIARAKAVLEKLEQGSEGPDPSALVEELPLFAAARPQSFLPEVETNNGVLEKLGGISPDALSPREALEIIYDLKRLADS